MNGVCIDENGWLTVSEIASLGHALYRDVYLTQVEEDAAGLCTQLFDSLPRRRHSPNQNEVQVEDKNSYIAISGK